MHRRKNKCLAGYDDFCETCECISPGENKKGLICAYKWLRECSCGIHWLSRDESDCDETIAKREEQENYWG